MIVFDRVINTMHLVDIGCKACGSRGPFNIELMCLATVNDGWIDHGIGTDTWALDAKCACTRCGRTGTVGDFTIDGLDDRLTAGATVEARSNDIKG